jgi:hypothetical protein
MFNARPIYRGLRTHTKKKLDIINCYYKLKIIPKPILKVLIQETGNYNFQKAGIRNRKSLVIIVATR